MSTVPVQCQRSTCAEQMQHPCRASAVLAQYHDSGSSVSAHYQCNTCVVPGQCRQTARVVPLRYQSSTCTAPASVQHGIPARPSWSIIPELRTSRRSWATPQSTSSRCPTELTPKSLARQRRGRHRSWSRGCPTQRRHRGPMSRSLPRHHRGCRSLWSRSPCGRWRGRRRS